MVTQRKPFSYEGPFPKESLLVATRNRAGTAVHEWVIDVPAMTSNYKCIYGEGCKGTVPWEGETKDTSCGSDRSATGCCRTEVGFDPQWDPEDNPHRLAQYVEQLSPDEWENHDRVHAGRRWFHDSTKNNNPRMSSYQGNCIFLNLGDKLPGKPGCALYHLAKRIDVDPSETRPQACHTVPLRMYFLGEGNEEGSNRHLLTLTPKWYGWFGGQKEDWWCTDSPEAYVGTDPVYIHMESEMRMLCGDGAYEAIKAALDEVMEERGDRIKKGWGSPVSLPMPKVRRLALEMNREFRKNNGTLPDSEESSRESDQGVL